MCKPSLILTRLSREDMTFLRRGAKAAARAESKGMKQVEQFFNALEDTAVNALMTGQEPPEPDFLPLLLGVAYNAMDAALTTQPRLPDDVTHLAAAKRPRLPRTPAELTTWWDWVRPYGKGKPPRRLFDLAHKIKRVYIGVVQSLWQTASEKFRQGAVWDQDSVRADLRRATRVGRQRARVIVATETTRYFNQARRSYYDGQPTVTHYLFVAIRDKRTTNWCQTRQGLVYAKDSEYLANETPPIHYQCRSEMLPLSPFNPRHKSLINDPTIQRENRRPAPLLKGWNK